MGFLSKIFKKRILKNDWLLFLDIGSKNIKAVVLRVDQKIWHGYVFGYCSAEIFNENIHKKFHLSAQSDNHVYTGGNPVERAEGKNYEKLLEKAINKAIFEASKMAGHESHEMVISFSGNILGGRRDIIKHTRHRSNLRINSHEFKNLVQMAKWQIRDSIEKNIGKKNADWERGLWYNIQDAKIDNYRVTNPIGFRGKEIYLDIISTFIKSDAIVLFYRLLGRLKKKLLATLFLPYAIADAILMFKDIDFALVFNVGALNTDIILINNNAIHFIDSIPFGGENFSYRLSKELFLPRRKAEKIKIKYSSGMLSRDAKAGFNKFFEREARLFKDSLDFIFKDLWKISLFPQKVFLIGQAAAIPAIENIVEDYFKNVLKKENIFFEKITLEDIKNIKNLSGIADENAFLPILCAASSYLNRLAALRGDISEADFRGRAAI